MREERYTSRHRPSACNGRRVPLCGQCPHCGLVLHGPAWPVTGKRTPATGKKRGIRRGVDPSCDSPWPRDGGLRLPDRSDRMQSGFRGSKQNLVCGLHTMATTETHRAHSGMHCIHGAPIWPGKTAGPAPVRPGAQAQTLAPRLAQKGGSPPHVDAPVSQWPDPSCTRASE